MQFTTFKLTYFKSNYTRLPTTVLFKLGYLNSQNVNYYRKYMYKQNIKLNKTS